MMENNQYLNIYLEKLLEKAKDELSKSYNYKSFLENEFEIINAFLIDKTMNQTKLNLFIQSIAINTKHHYYLPVIMSVAASTFLNNYYINERINYNIGDILQDKKGKQFRIIKIKDNLCSLESKIRGRGKQITFKKIKDLNSYFLTTKKELKKRRTKIKFKNYEKFFGSLFKIDNLPSRFSNKSVVILEKKRFFEAIENQSTIDIDFKKTIPFKWVGRNGINDNNSEFIHIEPMIYLVPDYETFKEQIYNRFEKIDSVIFIGKNKYEHCITKIKRDIRTNKIKKVIFIGSKDILDFDNLTKWKWTYPELQIINEKFKIEPSITEITSQVISRYFKKAVDVIQFKSKELFFDITTTYVYIEPKILLLTDEEESKDYFFNYFRGFVSLIPIFIHIKSNIYIAPNYKTFKNFFFNDIDSTNSIVFVGNNRFERDLKEIKEDILINKIKKVYFIDVESINNSNELKWFFSELQNLNSRKKVNSVIIEVTAENFSNSIIKFKEMIRIIETEYFVDLKSILYYLRHLFSTIVTLDDTRLIKQVEYIRLNLIEKTKNILTDFFLEIDENPNKIINEIIAGINHIFNSMSCDKFIHLIIKDNIDIIIVPSFLKNAWEETMDLHNISPKRDIKIFSIKEYLKKQSQYFLIQNVYVLSLFGYQMESFDLIKSIRATKHRINYLFYPEEKALYNEIIKKIEREQNKEYQSSDRFKLSGIDFELKGNSEPINEKIEQLFANYTDFNYNYKHNNVEEIFYEIVFDNNDKLIIEGNKSIILISQSNTPIKEKVSNLRKDDRIRIYENTNRKKLLTLAIQEDNEGRLDTIFFYSKLWKKSLNKYYNRIDNIFYNENKLLDDLLTNGAKLKLPTLKNWLDMSDDNYFPGGVENLRAIQRTIQNKEFDMNFKEILKSRKLYRSIMITLGHNLSDELTDYIISEKKIKGEFLKKFSNNQVDIFLKNTAPIKIIKNIEIIERGLDE